MATVCTVAGVARTDRVKRGTVSITKVPNGRDTFSCVFVSKSAASIYRPVEGDKITYSIEGSIPAGFGGTIVSVEETAVQDPDVAWACRVDAVNFSEYLDLIMVDDVWPANGLWDRVYYYWLNYISPRFPTITYGGATSGGDPLPASTYSLMTLQDVFEEWAQFTGKFFNIGGDELLAWGTPGGVSGPVVLSESNGGLQNGSSQGIKRRRKRLTWYTRGYMKVSAPEGTAQDAEVTINNETYTASGVVGEFPLKNRPVTTAPTQIQINGAGAITLPSGGYSYDASKKAIVKTLPYPTAGTTINVVQYKTKYPITVVYDDQKTQIRETIIDDAASGTTLAQAYEIAKYTVQESSSTPPTEAEVKTRENGFYIGMAVALNFARRNVVGSYWVTQIQIRDIENIKPTNAKRHWYVLTCTEGTYKTNPWQKDLKRKLGGGSGSSGSSIPSGSVGTPGGTGAISPLFAGGRNDVVVDNNGAGVWTDIPFAVPMLIGGTGWPAQLRLQAYVYVLNSGTSMTLRVLEAGTANVLATTSATNVTSVAALTATFTTPSPAKRVLVQYNITGTAGGGVIGMTQIEGV